MEGSFNFYKLFFFCNVQIFVVFNLVKKIYWLYLLSMLSIHVMNPKMVICWIIPRYNVEIFIQQLHDNFVLCCRF